jgi:OMF family outer membrane factor
MQVKKQGFIYLLVFLLLQSTTLNLFSFANENEIENTILLDKPKIKLEARIDEPLDIDLEKALSIALLQNLDITSARINTDLYKWKLYENYSNYLPDVKGGLSGQRLDGTFLIGGVFPIMTLTSSVSAFLRFDYRFLEGGMGFFNTLAANKLYKSSKENLSINMKDVLLQVTDTYYQLLKEQAQAEVVTISLNEAKSVLDLNQKLQKQGVGTKFDVLQSEAQYAEQEQAFINQQAKSRDASINLARLLNLEQGTHINPDLKDLKPRKIFDTDRPILEIITLAKENRSELKKARLDYNAQKNYIGVAYSGFLPNANFYGQYGGNGRVFFNRTKIAEVIPDAIALDGNGNPVVSMTSRVLNRNVSDVIPNSGKPYLVATNDSLMASKFIGVQVDWDFGKGLGTSTVSQINQARYQAMLAKNNIEISNQKIEQEVRSSYLKVQTTEKLIDVSKKRLIAATEALRLAKLRLENGVGLNTELLNAQKQYSSALAASANAIIDYNTAQAELVHSLGIISVDALISPHS